MSRDDRTEAKALEQVCRYLDTLGLDMGWLVFFDLRKDVSWEEKLFVRECASSGKVVRIAGC